jgi:acetyl esterase/lipase
VEQVVLKTGITVLVPDYPLAPENTVIQTFAFMEELYQTLLQTHAKSQIVFIGDSAGAGLALAFAQHLQAIQLPQPVQLFLLSPWLDLTMSHPEQSQYEAKDHILSRHGLKVAATNYAGTLDLHDYRVSPLYGNHRIPAVISIFTGTADLLHPEAKAFSQQLQQLNMPHHYYEYPDMFHDWVIVPALKESKEVIAQIAAMV